MMLEPTIFNNGQIFRSTDLADNSCDFRAAKFLLKHNDACFSFQFNPGNGYIFVFQKEKYAQTAIIKRRLCDENVQNAEIFEFLINEKLLTFVNESYEYMCERGL